MLIALVTSLALAGGYYHPDDIAMASQVYARAATEAGGSFEAATSRSEAMARALEDYELALDLLGDVAPAAERTRHQELLTRYNREHAKLEAFAGVMMEDFDAELTGAMERAIQSTAPDAVECAAMIPQGKPIPGIRQRMIANPDCKGDDLNAAIAAAMDADPELNEAIDEILALEWPAITMDEEPQGQASPHAHVDTFLRPLVQDELKRIDRADEDARIPMEAAIEEGATKDELAKLVEEGRAITAATAAARAELAAPILEAAEKRWSKLRKGESMPGWCANPRNLGGCAGDDLTGELKELLEDDAKFLKALP